MVFFLICYSVKGKQEINNAVELQWSINSRLPLNPEQINQRGLAGSYSGIINNKLVVAGGANFPDSLPWEGGTKHYWSDIYVLSLNGEEEWKVFPDTMPRELAYGESITLSEGILLIGGENSNGVYKNVYLLQLNGENMEPSFMAWPDLPVPLTNMTGALIDNKIYIAGGQEKLGEGPATSHFFVLDLHNKLDGWKRLKPWPGPPRAFAVSAGQSDGFDNAFYLFSGRNFGPERPTEILLDGYEYNPRLDRWKKIDTPDGPQFPVMAGSAMASGENHILFIGGDDGALMKRQIALQQELDSLRSTGGNSVSIDSLSNEILNNLNTHPGFSRDVLFYHTITNTVTKSGEVPFAVPVTTNLIQTGERFLITSGEVRPGVRTPEILSGKFVTTRRSLGWINSLVIAIYFGILVWMGWFFSKRQKNTNDYFRGGKQVPWWLVGLSIFGTALSAITFMAIPAKAYATDWSYIILNAGIIAVAPLIILLCIPFYRKLDITTAYEYLEQRFNVAARLVASVSFILFQVGRMGVVLFLPAIALNVVTGIDIYLCIGMMGIFSLIYTMLGGIEAVIWTDALQVVVLLGGAILAVILISFGVEGGFTEIISKGIADGKFHLGDLSTDLQNPTLLTLVIAALFVNLTTYGTDQTMVQRYVSTETEKMAGKSIWTNAILTIPGSLIFFFVGTALYVFYKDNPLLVSPVVTGGDSIFPWFIYTQMPPGIVGLLIAGIFAAAMSTLSSSMNSAATAYSVDMHFRFGWSDKINGLRLARIATLVLGVAGILAGLMMATWDIKSLWDEFQRILGLILGGIGGLFFLGLLTKRANGIGAMIGLLGSILVQVWISQQGYVHLLLYAATGFISCFILGYAASLLIPAKDRDITHLTIYSLWDSKEKSIKGKL